jgi:putative colanic acid biosynthesis acetyltransferase WcaF
MLDIDANRRAKKWTQRELIGRTFWESLGGPLFRMVPRPLWGVRVVLLRSFGARIGRRVHIHPTVRIAVPWNLTIGNDVGIGDRAQLYSLGNITIGDRATISQNAHLCAGSHDHRDPTLPLLKPSITIGFGAWICADAFVGPGVTVETLAVVAARAVAVRDVAANAIVAGNPARQVSVRELRARSEG